MPQSTEKAIGPYELQDFNLFYTLRFGFRPSKIAFLALHAWRDVERGIWPVGFPPERRRAYDLPAIREWLIVFVRRFFGFAQFKRSAMPNGPKVSHGGSLSPRGDWRAPSDGNAAVWLADIERNVPAHRKRPPGRKAVSKGNHAKRALSLSKGNRETCPEPVEGQPRNVP